MPALAEGGQGHGRQRGDQYGELAETLSLHIPSMWAEKTSVRSRKARSSWTALPK
jgi:hypothetical protein